MLVKKRGKNKLEPMLPCAFARYFLSIQTCSVGFPIGSLYTLRKNPVGLFR